MRLRECKVGQEVRVKAKGLEDFFGRVGKINRCRGSARTMSSYCPFAGKTTSMGYRQLQDWPIYVHGLGWGENFAPRELELISSPKEVPQQEKKGSSFVEIIDASVALTLSLKGKKYIHFNVPFEVVLELMKAKSLGKFYNTNIKGKYATEAL